MCLEVRQDHANTLKSIEDLVAIYRCKRTTLCSTGSMNHLVASQRLRLRANKDMIKWPLLEYPEAVRACAMRHYPRNLGTFFILIVFFHSSGCRPYSI